MSKQGPDVFDEHFEGYMREGSEQGIFEQHQEQIPENESIDAETITIDEADAKPSQTAEQVTSQRKGKKKGKVAGRKRKKLFSLMGLSFAGSIALAAYVAVTDDTVPVAPVIPPQPLVQDQVTSRFSETPAPTPDQQPAETAPLPDQAEVTMPPQPLDTQAVNIQDSQDTAIADDGAGLQSLDDLEMVDPAAIEEAVNAAKEEMQILLDQQKEEMTAKLDAAQATIKELEAKLAAVEKPSVKYETRYMGKANNAVKVLEDGVLLKTSKGSLVVATINEGIRTYGKLLAVSPRQGLFVTDRGIWGVSE
jgi:hypothetical protein